jgi:hypothetical protein
VRVQEIINMSISNHQDFWHNCEASLWEKAQPQLGVQACGGDRWGRLFKLFYEKLRERGATRIFVPRKAEYDLRQRDAILDLLHDTNPHIIIHLAASVGGIGADPSRRSGGASGGLLL